VPDDQAPLDWRDELARLLRELTGLARDGRRLLAAELEDSEAALTLRFTPSDAQLVRNFIEQRPPGEVFRGVMLRAMRAGSGG
jgi:phage host-nuclease inhibitor protein Gam